MEDNVIVSETTIQNKIYSIRSTQVILDRDLADLYGVKSIRLREQVKRNINRFPNDFMFQLTNDEVDFMVSQNAIPSRQHLGGSLPYVFTEQGVSMLSSVLKSKIAVDTSISIVRAFVKMRRVISNNAIIFQRLDMLENYQKKRDSRLDKVLDAIEDKTIKPKQGVFYDGQVFDAYIFVSGLVKDAKKSIVLIDNYIDESVLTLFSKNQNVDITIYSKNISKQLKLDLKKYNTQYKPIELQHFKESHDRFIIIDEMEVYHFGASLKDLGKKWFAFSKFDVEALEMLGRLS